MKDYAEGALSWPGSVKYSSTSTFYAPGGTRALVRMENCQDD